ncbi:NfeD family protein [Comamonas odontotermitis]|uniref:NfeD family protein n=1 Tax=Comamonas odontotermitis TaxID=379895 RepID=UPI00375329E3
MALSSIWWLMAGIAVIAELLTGTLYLLMVAIGLAAAAIAAHLGAGETTQVVVAAIVSAATVLACYLRQKRLGALHNTQEDRSIHLDIGEQLTVDHWQPDGTAQVRYRGAQWTAVLQHGTQPTASGHYRVVRLDGNRLMVEPAAA